MALFYPYHPWDLRPTTHKIKLSVNPTTHITQFSGEPLLKNWKSFFSQSSLYLNTNNPQDPIWTKDTHRTAFLRRTELRFYKRQLPTGLENNQSPPPPKKYSDLPSKTPIFFHLEQPLAIG